MKKIIVGMFGTCESSLWRNPFLEAFKQQGIDFFNPNLGPGEWTPAFEPIEAENLATNEIILLPVTNESFGGASLAEIGFAAASIKGTDRHLIVYVAPEANDVPLANDAKKAIANLTASVIDDKNSDFAAIMKCANEATKQSNRARGLVLKHLSKLNQANVHVVNSVEEMLTLVLELYNKMTPAESVA